MKIGLSSAPIHAEARSAAYVAVVPGLWAVKMPLSADGDFASEMGRLRSMTPESFAAGHSGDWGASEALLAGSDGWFSIVAGLLPEPVFRLTRAAQAGDAAKAKRIDTAFQQLCSHFGEFGSFRVITA